MEMEIMDQRNKNNKTLLWITIGCLGIIVCILAVVLLGFGGLVWLGLRSPDNANITTNVPFTAAVGDNIEFDVTVTNTSSETIELSSIDISLNYLNGFTISRTNPSYTDTSQYDSLGGGETFQTYYFHQSIEPGDTLTITFSGKAVLPGDFSGSLDTCIDSDFNCATNIVRTVIK